MARQPPVQWIAFIFAWMLQGVEGGKGLTLTDIPSSVLLAAINIKEPQASEKITLSELFNQA